MPNSVLRRPVARWAVPATVVTAVVGAAVAGPLIAGADSELPDRTAAELLVDLASIDVGPFAGTVVQSADLGLPTLPQVSGAEADSFSAAAMSLLGGSSTARIWYTDGDTYRLALQDELAETDLVRNGTDLWFWSSQDNSASHATIDEETAEEMSPGPHGLLGPSGTEGPDGEGLPEGTTAVPGAAAAMALQAIAPTTQVDVDGTATVAGRAAYELVLRPRDEQSLIGSIRLAVDGENSMPLRVQIFDRDGGDPAFEVGFTSVTFSEPDDSVYDFEPPAGTEIEEIDPTDLQAPREHATSPELSEFDADSVSVVGSGWSSVLVVRDVDVEALTAGLDPDAAALADSVLSGFEDISGPYGNGRVLSTELVSALLLDDGRLLVGAVAPEVLEEAAMDPAAAL
ncbi:LolA family protein [Jiangella asiatica]|uniref:MucB/RseB N-terminal domain-containing protein n=1 Tax=Jiangella asiatica TaxID=2530372 RepID=A0A4R5CLK2_9ACTN|nr:sigma-E factor regulatory protein RseB domain-containing protein [Jiangella asiatica]TDE00100.1 hypothetical protein E1269_26640 [Jiangella asiatica]